METEAVSFYDLHQAKPGFHGQHIFLDFKLVGEVSATATIKPHRGTFEEVATIYLPTSKAEAFRRACAAFNTIMDEVYVAAPANDEDKAEAA